MLCHDVTQSIQASQDVVSITVLHLNVEGLTKAKTSIIEHLTQARKSTAILLQETHKSESSRLKIRGFTLAASTKSDIHGIATSLGALQGGQHLLPSLKTP